MTDALHVRRLHARYQVHDGEQRRALDGLLDRVVGEALEPALARCGVPVHEEICIRAVRAPVRLRLAAGDATAAAAWAAAIAEAIAALLAAGSPDVVRYRSRRAALADLALGVAHGRLERVWAWRRLGLWRGGDVPGDRAAGAELAAALAREPEAIAPVVAEVARAGVLGRLLVTIAPREWTLLAAHALAAAGVSAAVLESVWAGARGGAHVAPPEPGDSPAAAPAPHERAERIARRSAIARAVPGGAARPGVPIDPEVTAALAVLAALEVEPAALVAGSLPAAGGLAAALAARLAPGAVEELRRPPGGDAAASASETPARAGALGGESITRIAGDAPEPPEPPRRHLTAHGGLLFLLSVLETLELAPILAAGERPLPWTLHLLALALAPVEPDDPAALAFAGLHPEAEPPTVLDPPEPDELAAASALAAVIGDHVLDRLGVPEVPPSEALEFVIGRHGELVFDPGWIELRMPIEEVSVELRRAGLDLDPGWLPWLGAVLRFVYVT
jgi:hypothetical protein